MDRLITGISIELDADGRPHILPDTTHRVIALIVPYDGEEQPLDTPNPT